MNSLEEPEVQEQTKVLFPVEGPSKDWMACVNTTPKMKAPMNKKIKLA
jgi:hypothetical protein